MLRPTPRVRVLEWSKQMRLKRRFEVRVCSPDPFDHSFEVEEEDEVCVPVARLTTRAAANAYAKELRQFLAGRPR